MKNTLGYPNFDGDLTMNPSYDLKKWMEAMKNLYLQKYRGLSHKQAMENITIGWNPVELEAFSNWLKYYESGEHFKYKTAANAEFPISPNNYYINDDIGGYFIPNPIKTEIEKPINQQQNISNMHAQAIEEIKASPAEKKRLIDAYKNKLIGRIISLRKLFNDGIFEWEELEQVLNTLNQLENQIRSLKKVSLSTTTYQDLIIRQAHILQTQGFHRSADFIFKLGQNVPGMFNPSPSAVSEIDVKENNALTNNDPNISQPGATDDEDSLDIFLENLDTAGVTEHDENNLEDYVDINDLEEGLNNEDGLVVKEAQLAPPAPPAKPMDVKPEIVEEVGTPQPTDKPLTEKVEVKEQEVDALISKALENVTVQDAIDKLEEIAVIFKNREISHQFALIDLIFRKLNLSSLFIELAESSQKILESSNYIISRIETMIAKLRGSVQDVSINLKPEESTNPEARKIRENLEQEELKDKERKELRKKQQDQKLVTPAKAPTPAEELEVELPEAPVAPPAKPAQPATPVPQV